MNAMDTMQAMEQASNEQRAWALTKNPHLSMETLHAHIAGFDAGWQQAISFLKLHGELTITKT